MSYQLPEPAFSRSTQRARLGAAGSFASAEGFRDGKPDALFTGCSRAVRTGLQLRDGIDFEAWCRIGRQVGALADASAWWIGDWLVYGQKAYPDRYRSAAELTGFSYQTLRNYAWVASQFPLYRRRDTLSFGHHAEVASLSGAEQDHWLRRAAEQRWSRNELRSRLRQRRRPAPPLVAIALQVEEARRERWRAAASMHSWPLAEWMTDVLDAAATAALETAVG